MLSKNQNCAETDPNVFFPDDLKGRQKAFAICSTCPDRLPCLMLAMQNVDEQGVWGGSIESERDYMRRYKVTPQEYVNIECGTEAAYFKHRRLREIPCADCKSVNAATRRRQMANGKKRVY